MTSPATGRTPLKCRHCRSTDLILHETRHEHAEWGEGGLFVNAQGHIEADGLAYFEPGEIQPALTWIRCGNCGREWRPRRPFDGIRKEAGK